MLQCFWIKAMKLAVIRHDAMKNVIVFDSILILQLWGDIFSLKTVPLCQQVRNPLRTNFMEYQNFHHLISSGMVSSSNPCHTPILSNEVIDLHILFPQQTQFMGNDYGGNWKYVFVSLKCFTHCLTRSTHMQTSLYASWIRAWIWHRNFFLNKKFYHYKLPKYVLARRFHTRRMTLRQGQVI
jgi:hypothetical protein